MTSVRVIRLTIILALAVMLSAAGTIRPAGAAGPLSKYESGERSFSELETENLLVYYHQRMLGEAIVEKDQIVYQFDRATGELVARKSHWRDDLPDRLAAGVMASGEAEALVEGEVLRSRLWIISPESDIFPLDPVPENPCWVVHHLVEGALVITIVDAVDGVILGNGVPPPYTGYSLTGPWNFSPCSGGWNAWMQNATYWFEIMGYSTEQTLWPTEDKVRSHVQSCETAMFYELAHGSHTVFESGCIGGESAEITYASEIETWIADYPKMPFAFIGSCGGLCWKTDGSFAYEFRKGEPESTTVVGYCNMAEPECDICWSQSIDWQTALFNYMNQGWTVQAAHDQAKADYPQCGDNRCMRIAGDSDFAVVPVVERDPWPPVVTVGQPNGGEVLDYGTVYDITWSATDAGPVDHVDILLSVDGGMTFPDTIAAGETNDFSYLWSVPDVHSTTARVKVVATDCSSKEGTDLSDADFTLWDAVSGIDAADLEGVPDDVVLSITGGNPLGGDARIVLGLPVSSHISLGVYDVRGRQVVGLIEGHLPAGYHAVRWRDKAHDGVSLSPGIYFLRLDSEMGARTTKAVLAR
jgi:hypothetical protein